jgi:hypothetical protein
MLFAGNQVKSYWEKMSLDFHSFLSSFLTILPATFQPVFSFSTHSLSVAMFRPIESYFFKRDPIYLLSVIIHSPNGGKGEGWHVEEYSVALLC